MCLSEKALEVRASVVRSESFALGKRFAVAKLSASLSPRAKLRPRLLVTSGRLFRHPRSKSAPAKISRFLAAGLAWKQANFRLSHPLSYYWEDSLPISPFSKKKESIPHCRSRSAGLAFDFWIVFCPMSMWYPNVFCSDWGYLVYRSTPWE